MKMKIENGIEYRLENDIWYPNLWVKEEGKALNKYGIMRKNHLMQCKKNLFEIMLVEGTLYTHCKRIEEEAKRMFDIEYKRLSKAGYNNILASSIAEELIFQYVIHA